MRTVTKILLAAAVAALPLATPVAAHGHLGHRQPAQRLDGLFRLRFLQPADDGAARTRAQAQFKSPGGFALGEIV